jgi:hypothetical protein
VAAPATIAFSADPAWVTAGVVVAVRLWVVSPRIVAVPPSADVVSNVRVTVSLDW